MSSSVRIPISTPSRKPRCARRRARSRPPWCRANARPPLENRERVVVDTPRIRQAVKTRATRNALTADLLATEHAYEQRTGLIAILRSRAYKDATTRQERDRNALVVMSENNDRWAIYEGLLEANDWPAKALPAVQAIFFEERVELLPAGTHYEGPGGDVVAKTP